MAPIQLFSVAGISVRASLGFLLLLAYFGYIHYGAYGPMGALLTIVAVIATLLVHEFGHALVARRYRLEPHILLHGWGGLCFHRPARSHNHDLAIVLGGPLLQLAVAGLVYGVVELVGPISSQELLSFPAIFVRYSVFWALLNLVPIFPLDGGHVLRLILIRFIRPEDRANRIVFIVGIALSGAAALLGFLVLNNSMLGILGVLWALENQRHLQQVNAVAGPPRPSRSPVADAILSESVTAFRAGDHHEARRLAFQARAEKDLAQDQLDQAIRIITVASAELADWDETLDWSRRAPRTPDVFMARLLALAATGHAAAARAELDSPDAVLLPPVMAERVRRALA